MKAACVSKSSADSTAIVAAVDGKRIYILGLQLVAAGDVTITIEDSDGTNLIGPMALSANGGFVFEPVDYPCLYQVAPVGKAINLLLSAGVQVGGSIQYVAR